MEEEEVAAYVEIVGQKEKSSTEQNFCSKGEKITDGTEMRGKYAAEHSK